jgi:hypothetical protein
MLLKNNHEVIGYLYNIEKTEGMLKIRFTAEFDIDVPVAVFPVEKLQDLLGQRIGILNIDGEYRLRKI